MAPNLAVRPYGLGVRSTPRKPAPPTGTTLTRLARCWPPGHTPRHSLAPPLWGQDTLAPARSAGGCAPSV